MPIDKKELAELPAEERIKKLKLMEEHRKKEVDEIEKLIKDSMQELKTKKLADDIAPEQKPVDISKLFETADSGLERTARKESLSSGLMKGNKGYQALVQTYQDYSQLKEFYGAVSMGEALTKDQLKAIGQIGERLNIAERYMTEGEKAASKLDPSRSILYKLKKETGLF